MTLEEPQNHRTRVAAERREETRVLPVFAQKRPQAVFNDAIAKAGMALIRAETGVKCGHDYFETQAVTCIRPCASLMTRIGDIISTPFREG